MPHGPSDASCCDQAEMRAFEMPRSSMTASPIDSWKQMVVLKAGHGKVDSTHDHDQGRPAAARRPPIARPQATAAGENRVNL